MLAATGVQVLGPRHRFAVCPAKPGLRSGAHIVCAKDGVRPASLNPAVVLSVDPSPAVVAAEHKPNNWLLPAGVVGAILAGIAIKTLSGKGSDKEMLHAVNAAALEELSDDAIQAARARRRRERANHKLSLEDVELPENHPFAVKKALSREEEEVVRARLQVRRGSAARAAAAAADTPGMTRRNGSAKLRTE